MLFDGELGFEMAHAVLDQIRITNLDVLTVLKFELFSQYLVNFESLKESFTV